MATHADRVEHVQIADAPGRHEPGTSELDPDGYLRKLEAAGYDGWVALEYTPRADTVHGLLWLPPAQRSTSGRMPERCPTPREAPS
ncbi:TIM barrel protein [Nocardioides gansuensis]|uniref:TIM barrel protein n=1 Tax=Nocardioides gansuensis TaxID=2138300 RepID=UPI00318412EB